MVEKKKISIWQFYLNDDLYAYTDNRAFMRKFEIQRDIVFLKKKVKMDSWELHEFKKYYNNYTLFEGILTDGCCDYFMMMTFKEWDMLNNVCDEIYDTLIHYENDMKKLSFGKEVRKALMVFEQLRKEHEDPAKGKFNTFRIFVELFPDTFL